MTEFNAIAGSITRPLGMVYPDSGLVQPADDYTTIRIDLDENDNSVVLDFSEDYGTDDARGATVRLRRGSLITLIHMLQAGLECLQPGEKE